MKQDIKLHEDLMGIDTDLLQALADEYTGEDESNDEEAAKEKSEPSEESLSENYLNDRKKRCLDTYNKYIKWNDPDAALARTSCICRVEPAILEEWIKENN